MEVLVQCAHIYTSFIATRNTLTVVPVHTVYNARWDGDLLELRHSYPSHHHAISTSQSHLAARLERVTTLLRIPKLQRRQLGQVYSSLLPPSPTSNKHVTLTPPAFALKHIRAHKPRLQRR